MSSTDRTERRLTRREFARRSARLGLAASAGAFLAACGPSSPSDRAGAAGGDPIRVGAVVALTGRYAALGELIKNAYDLAVEDINRAGGVEVGGRRRPLELITLDDQSDPTKTVQRLETLNATHRVAAYLGSAGSDLHAAAAAVAEKNRIPYLGVAFALQSVHQRGYQYLFSPFPKSPAIASATFDLLDALDPRPARVAIFAESTDWGNELDDLWRAEVRARGYQLVVDQRYMPGARDYAPLIGEAKDLGAQVLLALPSGPDGIAMVKQMQELAFAPAAAFILRAPDGATWTQTLGRDGDAVMHVVGWSTTSTFPGSQALVERYQERHNRPPGSSVGPAYAAVQVLADAVGRAGGADRRTIRDALAATDLPATAIGPVRFNPDGTGRVGAIVTQYQDGAQVAVWPREQATKPVLYPAKPFAERGRRANG
jgi:branched-chain amino acid transport system substrate-binding protein